MMNIIENIIEYIRYRISFCIKYIHANRNVLNNEMNDYISKLKKNPTIIPIQIIMHTNIGVQNNVCQ